MAEVEARLKKMKENSASLRWMAAAVVLGVCVLGCVLPASGQNTAQRNALAKRAVAQGKVHRNAAPPDGVEAVNATLARPGGLAFDAAGNLYVADTDDNVVIEVNLVGTITTVAGTGEQGYGGDGGAATGALLDSPTSVAVDGSNNIYIADTHNNAVREVTGGVITTIAGTGIAGFSGDGGAATAALLNYPTAVAVDSAGKVYVADTNNHRIREISGGTINTVAGNGDQGYEGDGVLATATGLDSPNGVAVDSGFNIYIGDTHNQLVRMVSSPGGIISTLAGNGTKGFNGDGAATSAALARPRGVAVDGAGKVYVADSDNHLIRTISGGSVSTIAGNGSEGFSGDGGVATGASLDTPRAVALSGSEIALTDTENNVVRAVNGGIIDTLVGQPQNTESLVIASPASITYGTGTLTATLSNVSNPGTGVVTFYDGVGASPATVGTASLVGNVAALNTGLLTAGTHSLVASYAGDVNNPPVASGVFVLSAGALQLTDVPDAVNISYGQAIPTLTGTLSGVLAQDSGNVTAVYATAATSTSAPGLYPITVQLAGSAQSNYTVVPGGDPGEVTISQALVTNVLTSSNASVVVGTQVTFTATVGSTTTGTPTGTATFFDGSALLGTGTVTGGVATFSTSSLAAGSHSISAVYSGDSNFSGLTSNTFAQQMLYSAAESLTVLPSPATIGSPVTFTATVGTQGGVIPTGSVRFFADFQPLGLIALNGAGVATFQTSTLPVGVHSIAASYTGDTNYSLVNATPVTLSVTRYTASVSVGSSAPSAGIGSPVTLTATATGSGGTPTGTVSFFSNNLLIGQGRLVSGVASLQTSTLPGGVDTVTAHYSGDGNYLPVISPNFTQVIAKQGTTVSLAPLPNPVSTGAPLTLTATVAESLAGVTPSGTVRFFDGYTLLGSGALTSGVATYQTSSLAAGKHSLSAEYSGDVNYSAASGAASDTVAKTATTVAVTTPNNPSTAGETVTFTATVGTGSGTANSSGTVNFYSGNTLLGTGVLSNNQATFATNTLPHGVHTITAQFWGDANYLAARSPNLTEVIH